MDPWSYNIAMEYLPAVLACSLLNLFKITTKIKHPFRMSPVNKQFIHSNDQVKAGWIFHGNTS